LRGLLVIIYGKDYGGIIYGKEFREIIYRRSSCRRSIYERINYRTEEA